MLEVGKVRAKKLGWVDQNDFDIEWMQCDAEKLPFEDDSYDAYTIAFGIRNVTHIEKVNQSYKILIKLILNLKDIFFFKCNLY